MKLTDENKRKPIITLHRIMEGSSFITQVFYDEDGDWQFFDSEIISETDYMVVGVNQIISVDNSLLFLPDMNLGEKVQRTSKSGGWEKF